MPSHMANRSSRDLYFKRTMAQKLAPVEVQTGGKFRGYEPDVSGLRQTWDGFDSANHLIPVGDYLQTDDGFVWMDSNVVDSATLPITVAAAEAQPVVGIIEWERTNDPDDPKCVTIATAHTASGNGQILHRPSPTSGWEPLELISGDPDPADDNLFASSERVLHDMAVFIPGAPTRGHSSGFTDIPNRICVWCTGYGDPGGNEPATPVLVIDGASHKYSVLTGDLSTVDTWFAAATCTEYQDRMVFGATREEDQQYPYRVRWSKVGDASVISTAAPESEGAGYLDLIELRTPIQRVIPLGDTLAVYSGDGVAFLSRTGRVTDPFSRRYVTKTRGLMGPQAVCSIGKDLHFGIFTDGWYTLSQSGDWNRVGLDESNGTRWDREFYRQLNYARRSQIAVGYDLYRQMVRISFVSESDSTQPNAMWNLDLRTNTVWPSATGACHPTYWAIATQSYTSSSVTWADMPMDWSTVAGVWEDYATEVDRIPAPVFGTSDGYVFQLDYSVVLQAFRIVTSTSLPYEGELPNWNLESHRLPAAQIGQFTVPDKLWINYEDVGQSIIQLGFSDTDGTASTQAVHIGGIAQGSSQSAYGTYRVSMRQLAWVASGQGTVRIRGIRAQLLPTTAEQIRPIGA